MLNFEFVNGTKIIFGKGTENRIGTETAKYSKKILFHYGSNSIKKSGLYIKVKECLSAAGIEFLELGDVQANPRLSLVKQGIELCRHEKIDFIVAVGGGSVIDSAKAIAVGVPYEGDVWDFYEGKAIPQTALGVATILTIPASGSESSNSSVITNEKGNFKRGLNSTVIIPQFSILNPEFTYTLPKYQTACGITDMLSHVLERYFTNVEHVDVSNKLCEALMKAIVKNGPIALSEPQNYDAHAEIMWSGTLAHNGLVGMGRDGDWASHRISHELSGIFDLAHGGALAIIFPAWMKYVYKHDVNRFAQYASTVWGIELDVFNLELTALKGIEATENFFKLLGLPTKLSETALQNVQLKFEEMAERATLRGDLGMFVKLNKDAIVEIFKLAY